MPFGWGAPDSFIRVSGCGAEAQIGVRSAVPFFRLTEGGSRLTKAINNVKYPFNERVAFSGGRVPAGLPTDCRPDPRRAGTSPARFARTVE